MKEDYERSGDVVVEVNSKQSYVHNATVNRLMNEERKQAREEVLDKIEKMLKDGTILHYPNDRARLIYIREDELLRDIQRLRKGAGSTAPHTPGEKR